MIVDEKYRFEMLIDLLECFRIFRIIFNEIAVQVIVSGISAEAVFFRSVLVRTAEFPLYPFLK